MTRSSDRQAADLDEISHSSSVNQESQALLSEGSVLQLRSRPIASSKPRVGFQHPSLGTCVLSVKAEYPQIPAKETALTKMFYWIPLKRERHLVSHPDAWGRIDLLNGTTFLLCDVGFWKGEIEIFAFDPSTRPELPFGGKRLQHADIQLLSQHLSVAISHLRDVAYLYGQNFEEVWKINTVRHLEYAVVGEEPQTCSTLDDVYTS